MSCSFLMPFLLLALQASPSRAQGWWGNGQNGNNPWDGNNGNNGDNDNNPFGSDSQSFSSPGASWNKALVAHAVVACLVWAFLIPIGGILLRLNIKSPWVLRLHILLQITSFLAYIVAVALGIYLVRNVDIPYYSLWDDSHPKLGLAILALAIFQPVLGFIHHRIFKRRQTAIQAGKNSKVPGRTTPAYIHIWLGRLLIVLGIINGGLGIRLAGRMQSAATTRNAAVGYGIGVGIMLIIYLFFLIRFEARREKAAPALAAPALHTPRGNAIMLADRNGSEETLPTYTESEESLHKNGLGNAPAYEPSAQATRYH